MADLSYNFMADGSTSLGGAPVAGQYMPNQTSAILGAQTNTMNAQTLAALLQADARTRGPTQVLTQLLAGPNAGAMQAQHGKAIQQLVGMVINNQAVSGLMGGSILDQFVGISAGLGASGRLTMAGAGGAPGVYMSGSGALNAVASRLLLEQQQNAFYGVYGGDRTHRTYGMNRTELGAISGYLGMSGAFGGMNIGTMHHIPNAAAYNQLVSRASSSGNTAFATQLAAYKDYDFRMPANVMELNQGTASSINEKISAAAKAVASIKDILGGRPTAELMANIEELSGVSLSTTSGAQAAAARVERIKTFAASHGLSAQGVIHEQLNISQQLQGMGVNARSAALMSERVQFNSQAAYDDQQSRHQRMLENGVYTQLFSREQINAVHSGDIAFINRDFRDVRGALAGLESRTDLSEAQKAQVQAAIADVTNARGATDMERRGAQGAALSRLRGVFAKVTGGDTVSNYYNSPLSAEGETGLADMYLSEGHARDKLRATRTLRRLDRKYGDGTASNLADMYMTMSDDTMSAVQRAMMAGDAESARGIIANADGLDSADKTRMMAIVDRQDAFGTVRAFGGAMSASEKAIADNPALAARKTKQSVMRENAANVQRMLASQAFGTGLSTGTLSSFIGGLMGSTQITQDALMEYGMFSGKTVKMGVFRNGQFQMADSAVNALLQGDEAHLTKMFGLTGNATEKSQQLKNALGSSDGYAKFMSRYTAGGGILKLGNDGFIHAMGSKDAAITTAALEKSKDMAAYKELLGGSDEDVRKALHDSQGSLNRVAGNLGTTLGQILDSGDVKDNKKWQALRHLTDKTGSTDWVREGLKAEEDKINKMADGTDKRKRMDNLQAMKDALDSGGKSPEEIGNIIVDLLKQIRDNI